MKLQKKTIDETIEIYTKGKPGETYYCILEREHVFHGASDKPEKQFNINAINRMQLGRLPLLVPGGCVVLQKGDLIVYHYSVQPDNFFANWVDFFGAKLKERNIPFELGHELFNSKHHDFLIKKKEPNKWWKVGTHSENFAWEGLYFCCFGIVDHINLKHIKQVTTVSDIKEPAGLSAWGISSEMIEQWFLEFMKKFYNEEPR